MEKKVADTFGKRWKRSWIYMIKVIYKIMKSAVSASDATTTQAGVTPDSQSLPKD